MSETATEQVVSPANPFDDNSWNEDIQPTNENQTIPSTDEGKQQNADTTSTEAKKETTEFDPNKFVKETFGYDSLEVAKQEIQRVKNFKEPEQKYKTVEELLGDKEEEILNHLSTKRKIERLTSAELDKDSSVASEIIKLSIKQKNPELTDDDAEFMFNEKYGLPSKPNIKDDELEDEYAVRLSDWEKKVSNIQRQMVIEAKMAKPELLKLKSELKYPEISTLSSNEPTPEDLEQFGQIREGYLSVLNDEYKKFDGFKAQFKDEAVEYSVPYTISDEEKESLRTELEDFDADSFFADRWFTKEGKPNINQMQSDLYLLKNRDKIFQKIANESGSQRLLLHIKGTTNTTIGRQPQGTFSPDNKSFEEKQKDAIWDA